MNTLYLRSEAISFDFDRAKRAADAVAHALLGESMSVSWLPMKRRSGNLP